QMFTEHWPTSAAQWLPHGRLPRPWEPVTNPAYADVLDRLVAAAEASGPGRETQYESARAAWGEGVVAEAVDAFQRRSFQDSSGAAHAGVISGADLAAWSPTYEPAVTQTFRRLDVAKH